MVIGINILAVPAAGKHELEADTVEAVGVKVGLVWKEVAVEGSFGSGSVVETVEAEGLLGEGKLADLVATPIALWRIGNRPGEVALTLVARDHLETFREGGDCSGGIAGIAVEKVVSRVC